MESSLGPCKINTVAVDLILHKRKLRPREVKKRTPGTHQLTPMGRLPVQCTFPQSVSLAVTLGTKPFPRGC